MNHALYNEIEEYPARWLENLSQAGHINPGDVDTRSIEDLKPEDIQDYTQFHAFAGIGAWSHALRLAGWPDDAPVWTGSCPCQPFSVAGKQRGNDDERHLFPAWLDLIEKCRPPVIFGEQVASPSGREWLDDVSLALETLGYAVGTADICAASVGAPHIRARLWFGAVRMADGDPPRLQRRVERGERAIERAPRPRGLGDRMAHTDEERRKGRGLGNVSGRRGSPESAGKGEVDSVRASLEGVRVSGVDQEATRGFWKRPDWLLCRDAKIRPVETNTFPLAYGAANRVGRLRAYGNAIVPAVASAFIRSFVEAIEEVNP